MDSRLAYLLGFFYADGYLKHTKHNTKLGPRIYTAAVIELVEDDTYPIEECLDHLKIDFTYSIRSRKNSSRTQRRIYISKGSNTEIFIKIMSNKLDMSFAMNEIPIELHKYFIRGFFDGDGCINISKNGACRLYFYGHFDQNWSVLEYIMQKLDIKYTLQQIIRKEGKHKSTLICISNKDGINKMFEYMYPHRLYDFGLFRKYEKLKSIKSLIKRSNPRSYKLQTADKVKAYT